MAEGEKIKRKWELISEFTKDEYPYLSRIAKELDNLIYSIYGNFHTAIWLANYEQILDRLQKSNSPVGKLKLIKTIAKDPDYCTCCFPNNKQVFCSGCKLAELDGLCDNPNSKYFLFIANLESLIYD